MDSGDIYIDAPEIVINDAIQTAKKAVDAINALLLHPWTKQMIDRKASAVAWQYNLNKEPLAEVLTEKIRTEIHTVTNPHQRPLSTTLEAWSNRVVENYGKNVLKHEKVVQKHQDYIEHINCAGKRNSIPIQKSATPTPEDELIEKEERPIWGSRKLEMRDIVRKVITEDAEIAYRWGRGEKPEQIAREMDIPVKTIYRKLSAMQKAVLEKIGIEETEENKALVKEGLRETFANSLRPFFETASSRHR